MVKRSQDAFKAAIRPLTDVVVAYGYHGPRIVEFKAALSSPSLDTICLAVVSRRIRMNRRCEIVPCHERSQLARKRISPRQITAGTCRTFAMTSLIQLL